VAVNSNGQMLFLRLAEIKWVKAANWGVELHVGHQTHRLRDSFAALTAKLPPDRFLRVSARVLVNVTQLNALRPRRSR
jgi:DNA-binding LytR/AlgR family response regulator